MYFIYVVALNSLAGGLIFTFTNPYLLKNCLRPHNNKIIIISVSCNPHGSMQEWIRCASVCVHTDVSRWQQMKPQKRWCGSHVASVPSDNQQHSWLTSNEWRLRRHLVTSTSEKGRKSLFFNLQFDLARGAVKTLAASGEIDYRLVRIDTIN